jgi:hypothetical protein
MMVFLVQFHPEILLFKFLDVIVIPFYSAYKNWNIFWE